ncbi:hypothetical protein THIOSC15_900003 [uncultured Thiomicrorhabdus sp.]
MPRSEFPLTYSSIYINFSYGCSSQLMHLTQSKIDLCIY